MNNQDVVGVVDGGGRWLNEVRCGGGVGMVDDSTTSWFLDGGGWWWPARRWWVVGGELLSNVRREGILVFSFSSMAKMSHFYCLVVRMTFNPSFKIIII